MSRTVSPENGRPYGLARVCRVWRASRATVYRHISPSRPEPPRRPGPVGPMPDAALLEAIRAVLTASPFHGERHRKIWARLRVAGVRTSKRRVLRLMRENDLLARCGLGRCAARAAMEWTPPTASACQGGGVDRTLKGGACGASYHDRTGYCETDFSGPGGACGRSRTVPQAYHTDAAVRVL